MKLNQIDILTWLPYPYIPAWEPPAAELRSTKEKQTFNPLHESVYFNLRLILYPCAYSYLPDDVILETVRMLNFDELVTYNRTHMTAYAVLRPIFNLARECGIKTWPELDFELGPKILTEGCTAKIRKYSVLYTGVTLRALGMSKNVERVLGGIESP
jgi:hypothetical protein